LRTLRAVERSALPLERFSGGIAIYDSQRDELFTSLDTFDAASAAVEALPYFAARIGAAHASRVTLQVVYAYLTGLEQLAWDEDGLATVYSSLRAELADPDWTYVLLGNLTHYHSEDALIDFGGGLTIRHRSLEELRERLGWGDWHLERLREDWTGPGASEHIVYLEEKAPKSPDNFLLGNTATGYELISRLMLALWLHKPGDVQVGHLFQAQAMKFNVGHGGLAMSGEAPRDPFGTAYVLSAAEASDVREIFDKLAQNVGAVPPNVTLAIRRFSSIYGRGIHQREDRILDAITTLEALLGSADELTFKLSYRVASLLATDDEERVDLFESMKSFYRVRSRIVHGGHLSESQVQLVADDEPLRDVARRIIRGVLVLAGAGDFLLTRKYVDEELDKVLLHEARRRELQEAMGLGLRPSGQASA